MNIAEAKEQIKNAMRAYFTRDEYGNFVIPPQAQRPVFLMGPPGIGKTAIMSEIASELGVGLLSYSMTHHTRQSALGLPLISKKNYGGSEYDVTEYTMSEIIASVYDMMDEGGISEGILFLDEINCVSETLTPTMLQFLQYKTFGKHAVPGGWIVVTAGNPPEYNRSAREFDIVTWDRLKRIDIEPDYPAWKEYAWKKGVHASVLTYLDAKKESFYKVEAGVDGMSFVTARGWDDLSDMIKLYENLGIRVDLSLISQYLQDKAIAEDFAIYYDLWGKYKSDYRIDAILSGETPQEIKDRAGRAEFDERLSLLGLLLENVTSDLRDVTQTQDDLMQLLGILREVKAGKAISDAVGETESEMNRKRRRGAMSADEQKSAEFILAFLRKHLREQSDFEALKSDFDGNVTAMKSAASAAGEKLNNLFGFVEDVWADGQEMLILVTELSASYFAARFISRYGCDAYYRHNEELMFYKRQTDIIKQLENLETNI